MDEQDGVLLPDDVSNEEAIDSWDRVAEEFANYFADGEELYHKHIISPTMIDLWITITMHLSPIP